jgi:MOSC domain-containing protein YiiM
MNTSRRGRLIGIAVRAARRAPMQVQDSAILTAGAGVDGDHKGVKLPRRGVTILAREAWEAALAQLGAETGAPELPWTARRANLLTEDVELPRAVGGIIAVGPAVLEVTYPTMPCSRMEEARAGLMQALYPDWRGGVTCKVIEGGRVALGDPIEVLASPPERKVVLPG